MLWIILTISAAGAQTVRNALQRGLTDTIGALGAAHARFLYGLPFALGFVGLLWLTGRPPAIPTVNMIGWAALGGFAQIGATACLLAAMRTSSFVLVVAYTKTEPVLVLLAAWLIIGEAPTVIQAVAIIVATFGVMLMGWPTQMRHSFVSSRSATLGLCSGALFAISAVSFREGIISLNHPEFVTAATTTLAVVLTLQTLVLSAWLLLMQPSTMKALIAKPTSTLPAGFCGAAASALWFLAFALAPAPLVRTVGLVEIAFSQLLGQRLFAEKMSLREGCGALLVTCGIVGVLLGA
ncbi:MAG: DMT family transporter [Pseudomonadota bacterium]